jgi:hypothetical protein
MYCSQVHIIFPNALYLQGLQMKKILEERFLKQKCMQVQQVHCSEDVAWWATSSEQCTHLAVQHYATQVAFHGWSPNLVVTICTPDDGHAGAWNMLSQ